MMPSGGVHMSSTYPLLHARNLSGTLIWNDPKVIPSTLSVEFQVSGWRSSDIPLHSDVSPDEKLTFLSRLVEHLTIHALTLIS